MMRWSRVSETKWGIQWRIIEDSSADIKSEGGLLGG